VAQELHIAEDTAEEHDERLSGLLERAITMFWSAGELTGGATSAEYAVTMIDDTFYHQATCQVIEAAARRDRTIIVGHGASFALAGWPGVMHVGLYAPLERRVKTIMKRMQVDKAEAQRRITQRDNGRTRYIKQFYRANWHEADHYHLMIDTAQFVPEQVVTLIAQAWRTSACGG
jgi:cytidylate kinase